MPNSSHYETLNVPENARLETIRAAYKQLARQWHPDCNSNSDESHRQMQTLNSAFDVLSDPILRAEYDRSLASSEPRIAKHQPVSAIIEKWIQPRRKQFDEFVHRVEPVRKLTPGRWIARVAFVLLALWALNLDRDPSLHADIPVPVSSRPRRITKTVTPASQIFLRPLHAPNGSAWPVHASELSGYPVEWNDGKSIITVDNSRNPSDVFVKLIGIAGNERTAVRHLYIPSREVFECKNIRKGMYEIRYQDLGSGFMAKSGTFEVVETKTERAISFSSMKITLARITETKPEGLRLSASEF